MEAILGGIRSSWFKIFLTLLYGTLTIIDLISVLIVWIGHFKIDPWSFSSPQQKKNAEKAFMHLSHGSVYGFNIQEVGLFVKKMSRAKMEFMPKRSHCI